MHRAADRPVVSIVMAMYNAEATVAATVESIQAQTSTDWELIAVDDGSQDRTVAMVEAIEDPRIRVVQMKANGGQPAALNCGLEHARADLIARIDADDLWMPEKLARQTAYLARHPEVAVLGTGAIVFDDSMRELGTLKSVRGRAAQLRTFLLRNRLVAHISIVGRTELLRGLGGYSSQLPVLADLLLWSSVLLDGHVIHHLEEPLVRFRRSHRTFSAATAAGARLASEFMTFYRLLADRYHAPLAPHEAALLGGVVAGAPTALSDTAIVDACRTLARFQDNLLDARVTAAEKTYARRAVADLFWEHVARRLLGRDVPGAVRLMRCARAAGCDGLLSWGQAILWWRSLGRAGRSSWAPLVPGGSGMLPPQS